MGMMMGGIGGLGRSDMATDGKAYDPRIARRLLAYLRPYGRRVALAMALVLLATGAATVGPLLMKIGIDDGIAQGDAGVLAAVGGAYLVTLAVAWSASLVQVRVTSTIGQGSLRTLRTDMFRKLQILSLAYFSRHPLGAVMSRIANDVDVISEFVTMGVVTLVGDLAILIFTVALMFALDVRLSIVTLAVVPLMWLASRLFSTRARRAFREVRATVGSVYANLQESIDGVRTAQSFVREQVNAERFEETNKRNVDASIRAGAVVAGFVPVVDTISAIATALVIGVGGVLALDGHVTVGVLVGFLTLVARFFAPIQELTRWYNQLQSTMAAGEKIFELLDEPVEIFDRPGAMELARIDGRVEFRKVTFSYGDDDVLRDVSFIVEPGQRVALVGPTGAGKTTTINLLARFYEPPEASIFIDGIPIAGVTQRSLRSQMGVVPQDGFLFSGSIHANIAFARPAATRAEVEAAARAVVAHEFIRKLPGGYDTDVRERGARLSVGQRQLIAIARALLADPRILILDEATSSVDARTEHLIQSALEHLMRGRTTFVIAHRLATVRDADLILVFHGGRVVERGTHGELLTAGGLYRTLYTTGFPGKESVEQTSLPKVELSYGFAARWR